MRKHFKTCFIPLSLELDTPLAIRYPRGYSEIENCSFEFKKIPWGKGEQLKEGNELLFCHWEHSPKQLQLSTGKLSAEAFAHFDLCFAKPLDEELLHRSI